MVKVYCTFIKNGVYTKEWVYKLRDRISRNSTVPFEFICLTNEKLLGIDTIAIKNVDEQWAKIELCNPSIDGRVHHIGLDSFIIGNIDFFLREEESLLSYDSTEETIKSSSIFILNEHERSLVWNSACKFHECIDVYADCLDGKLRTIQEKHPGKIQRCKSRDDVLLFGTKILNFSGEARPSDFEDKHWLKTYYW